MNPHAAATPDDAEMSIEPGAEPLDSWNTSLPLTSRSGLMVSWKSSAVEAPSSTREIKSAIACVDDEEEGGFGHRMILSTAKVSLK